MPGLLQAIKIAPVESSTMHSFLPLISYKPDVKFFGIYLKQYWTDENVNTYLPPFDLATGKKHTAVGWFIDLEDNAFTQPVYDLSGNNFMIQLEALWKAGYLSFVNIGSNATASEIVNGYRDQEIGYMAEFYKAWIDRGEYRRAMLAPLQEMNGDWTSYGKDLTPQEFKLAYRHILELFSQKGVSYDQVWWVFAPNGWHDPAQPQRAFELYYPGDDVVDFVGFSSYNYGFCEMGEDITNKWESYTELFEPYITRMQAMAPSKPVIIAEIGTSSYYSEGMSDINLKNQWLIENYYSLASNKAVLGVIYFSLSSFDGHQCDLELDPGGEILSGYHDGLTNPIFRYLSVQRFLTMGY
ncbi:MAG: glycosyl hydrolase [Anaerolineaceae bacterium]